jgi:hypothetical protein
VFAIVARLTAAGRRRSMARRWPVTPRFTNALPPGIPRAARPGPLPGTLKLLRRERGPDVTPVRLRTASGGPSCRDFLAPGQPAERLKLTA